MALLRHGAAFRLSMLQNAVLRRFGSTPRCAFVVLPGERGTADPAGAQKTSSEGTQDALWYCL